MKAVKSCKYCSADHQNHSNPYCSLRCSIEARLVRRDSGCLEWVGATDQDGYGIVNWRRKPYRVHRAIYSLRHGRIADDKIYVCHTCDNPRCCADEHHFLGSSSDNLKDASAKGRCTQHLAKLTPNEVVAIRAAKGSQESIAAVYGVDQTTVSSIKALKTWKHIS